MNYPEILKGRVATYKCSGTIYSKGVYHLRWVWIDTTWSSLEAESDWFGFETLEECIEDHRVHVEKLHAMRHGGTISQLLPLPAREVGELERPAKDLSDNDLIAAATEAGLCHPQCWDFSSQPERLEHLRSFAHSIIARCSNHFPDATKMVSPAPAEGEVAILARWMRDCAESAQRNGYHDAENMHIRIAELLEIQFAFSPVQVKGKVANAVADLHAIADILSAKERHIQARKLTRAADLLGYLIMEPLPVSQRLPGPDDCDMEGRCWCFTPRIDIEKSLVFHARWILSVISDVDTHWLPYCSLPLPSGEVE